MEILNQEQWQQYVQDTEKRNEFYFARVINLMEQIRDLLQ